MPWNQDYGRSPRGEGKGGNRQVNKRRQVAVADSRRVRGGTKPESDTKPCGGDANVGGTKASGVYVLAPLTLVSHHRGVQFAWLLPILLSALLSAAQVTPVSDAASGGERPLPAIPELVKNLLSHQQELESVRKDYIFTMEEDEQEPDGSGGLKVKHHNTYEVHYAGPWVVQTLTAQDGRQLSPEEINAERAESDKEMRRARLSLAKLESVPDAQGNGGLRLSDFLAADQFLNCRRETFHGHEALVLDFVPNPAFRPRRAVEKILKNLSGKVWIEEQDLRGIRLEARLTDNVNFGGFLASVRKGTAVIFEQQKVNGEIWLPSYTELHFDARAFLSNKRINLVQRFSNYKKFRVESEVKPF